MSIYKVFKVRIYPNEKQRTQINKTLGCSRFLYNQMLNEHIQVYEKLKDDKRKLYDYKYKTEKEYKFEFIWLKEADAIALQQANIDLHNAYSNFFKSLKGERKGTKIGFPKFKKKKFGSSYRVVMATKSTLEVNFNSKKIKLPKVGWVKFRDGRTNFDGKIKSATVSRTSTGKYFVSVLYEQEFESKGLVLNSNTKIKGLDMSLNSFYVDELGNSPEYERIYRKYEKKLHHYQKQMSRKKMGSNNWKKASLKVNIVHEKISNCRNDFTHKLSKKLVTENDVIVIENLNLKGMSQCLNLGKSVMDLGYSEFVKQLQYKSLWNNKLLIEADKWFASSKLCSKCGYKKSDLLLSDREWICPNCNTHHFRDMNAGQNLVNYGKNILDLVGKGIPEFKLVEKISSNYEVIQNQEISVKQECKKVELKSQLSI
jgi:putative transposase